MDGLKTKGYFVGDSSPALKGDGVVYREMNMVKDAALSFARDRYDIFRSLSKEDIQRVVECGCPNLLRKAVNSGKRLRAHLQLDEGNVCSACNLRGSCDRAYVVLQELEGARTVDIVRILLFYALDPLVISSGEMPPGRSLVPASARNLLSELIVLSDKPPDPALPKPATSVPKKMEHFPYVDDDEYSQEVEMKRGDWMCPKCNFLNFAKNWRCLKCKEDGPTAVGSDDVEMKKGDWVCPKCSFMNFARNIKCLKCKTEGPKRVSSDDAEMKKGDWNCPQCGFMNFASKKACFRCREARPKRQLNPGEWECPSCDYLNYRRNAICLKCDCKRPIDVAEDYEEQMWRRPS